MNRLQTYYEQLQLPLKSLFFGSLLVAIGTIIPNPYVNSVLKLDSPILLSISRVLLMSGGIILAYFPLYVFIKLLSHEKNEPNIVVTGIISYLAFLVSMLLLSPTTSPTATYISALVIKLGDKQYMLYRTGIFGLIAIYLFVKNIYRKTSEKRHISNVSFADRETVKMVFAIVGSSVIGMLFAFGWPYFMEMMYSIMEFISQDVNNPMSLFAYGALERLMALANLDVILHQEFWLNTLGGTWMNLAGQSFVGDVNIWAGQLKETVNVFGAGRFTSAYYVMNIFAVPAYLIAISTTISNKRARNRNIGLLIAAILVSMVGGTLLPIEILMLLTSPTLYFFHLFATSFIYAILSGFSVALGFSFFGNLLSATPGNIIDLMGISYNTVLVSKVFILLLVGIIVFLVYFSFTRLYFNKLALDVLSITNKQQRIEDFTEGLGGVSNIETVSSTLTRIHVELREREDLNIAALHRQGVTRIVETRQGFVLSIGSPAYMIQKAINKNMKTYRAIHEVEEVEENEG
ncbi:PTS glucose transporter subunit IIBC [Erysipelothrix aquatica]|uniref:PTS glucose transporter subunit IIBC n=1 Tax=Erysipelothrix aquatica TaxID=2683714 RepID=UPI00135BDA55|nr:PTS glucose transporter subunit IIBC [Erysipelothrix aquatica]